MIEWKLSLTKYNLKDELNNKNYIKKNKNTQSISQQPLRLPKQPLRNSLTTFRTAKQGPTLETS